MDTVSQMFYIAEAAIDSNFWWRMIPQHHDLWCQASQRTVEVVRVGLNLRGDQVLILKLYSLPMICEPLTSHPLVDCQRPYPHLTGLELANNPWDDQSLKVDVLIGSDRYWDVIIRRLQRGADGPETKLGWVLSGPVVPSGQTGESHSLVAYAMHIRVLTSETQTLDDTMKSFLNLLEFLVLTIPFMMSSETQSCSETKGMKFSYMENASARHPQQL